MGVKGNQDATKKSSKKSAEENRQKNHPKKSSNNHPKKIVRNIAPTNVLTKATLVSSDSLSKTRKPQIVNTGEVTLKRSTNIQHTTFNNYI